VVVWNGLCDISLMVNAGADEGLQVTVHVFTSNCWEESFCCNARLERFDVLLLRMAVHSSLL
jgi:hypothetical protein